jgi:signal transduction histidine kinase/ActR/RegA family two-component response regulator
MPVNSVGSDALGWIFQQDYLTFLAVLGWLTAGLIAWGSSTASTRVRSIPWKWFAFFCFFLSLDETLDLARMVTVDLWPPQVDGVLRLAAYAYLLEFSRRTAVRYGWMKISPILPVALPVSAQVVALLAPNASPIPEITVAFVAGISGASVLIAAISRETRPQLAICATLALLGPSEILRSQSGVSIEGLYGLLVTGEGFASALTAGVLAWVAASSLWLYNVLRRRFGFFAGRPEASSPVAAFVLPAVLAATLAAGYFVVNWSSQNVHMNVGRDYLSRARTAALSVDADLLRDADRDVAGGDTGSHSVEKLRSQIQAIADVSDDIRRVYLWNVVGGRILLRTDWMSGSRQGVEEAAIVGVGIRVLPTTGTSHLVGPIGTRESTVIISNAPIRDKSGEHLAWLGIDMLADELLQNQAYARLQTIALVGLFSSLVVFFLAHVILREHEAELLVAKERAEAADRAKDEFLAVMSHELRTPMQSVLGYGELMARTPLNPAQTTYLETIRGQGRTLLRVVQDILDFSTLKKSSYALKRETVYLHRLVETVFESIKPLADKKALACRFTIGRGVPEVVSGDGVRIEQILLNLMGNAVKFTDTGHIHLDAELESTNAASIPPVSHVLFSIKDTGLGIRDRDKKRMFEPFTRLSYGENTRREGTGLGLAIVERLCELMGGTITLESQWGQGTQFMVHLPLRVAQSPAASDNEASTRFANEPVTDTVNLAAVLPLNILVADDNPFIRRLMVEYLRSIGYDPVAVGNGAEAAERWKEFDLMILDLRMPVMDGMTAAARIRAASGNEAEAWLIGVSATLAENEISKAMESGMNDFLGKPFFVQSLIEAIQATPYYDNRTGEPRASAAPPSEDNEPIEPLDDDDPPPTPRAGKMSWMPDLSAAGGSAIVEQALSEIPVVLDEISEALAQGDAPQAAERAHYLKNTIFALNIEPMSDPSLAVFERSTAGDVRSAQKSMDTLRTAFSSWSAARRTNSPTTDGG